MAQILDQLGGLLLGAVPTIAVFLLIVVVYRWLVYGPLTRVLEERRARTEGAIEQAQVMIAAAEAKAQEYEAKMRAAQLSVFHASEARFKQWQREREAAIADARQAARKQIAEAASALQLETARARQTLAIDADDLTHDVLRAVLPQDLAVLGSSR